MKWTQEDREKISRLATQDGWEVVLRWMAEYEKECAHRLANQSFADLLGVGRLQGKITALQDLRAMVERRGALE